MKIILFVTGDKFFRVFGIIGATSLLMLSFIFAFAAFHPVDVLEDWSLSGTKEAYTVGESVPITSSANKLMNQDGESTRYLVCTVNGVEQRYEIGGVDAKRAQGKAIREIVLVIPNDKIPKLPQKCYIQIIITYKVYGFRPFQETARTDDFIVESKS